MKKSVYLYGTVPSQKNSKKIFRNKRTGSPILVTDSKVTNWKRGAALALKAQLGKIEGPVKITFNFTHQNRVRRDLDNAISTLLDTLVQAEVIEDDKSMIVQSIEANLIGLDPVKYGVEVIIENIENPLT